MKQDPVDLLERGRAEDLNLFLECSYANVGSLPVEAWTNIGGSS